MDDPLYQVIFAAQNADSQTRRAAETALQDMVRQGVLRRLQTIALDQSLDLNTRRLSIIQAKNNTQAQWKLRAKTSDEDCAVMRCNALEFIGEPDDIIAKNNQLMTAIAARLDLLSDRWPNVLIDIISQAGANLEARPRITSFSDPTLLRARRSLSLLNSVIKQISTMRAQTGKKAGDKVVGEALVPVTEFTNKTTVHLLSSLGPSTIGDLMTLHDIEVCRMSWKCLLKVVLIGWAKTAGRTPELNDAIGNCFANSAACLQTAWQYRTNLAQGLATGSIPKTEVTSQCLLLLTKLVKTFGKFFRRLQQVSPERFVTLPNCRALVLLYWQTAVEASNAPEGSITDSLDGIYPVPLVVQGLAIFKEALSKWSPHKKGMDTSENADAALPREIVEQAVEMIITRFIPLKPSDLERWEQDPEEFLSGEKKEDDVWEFDIRPCSERVLMTLTSQYADYVVPLLLRIYQTTIFTPPADLEGILRREAVYCALGRNVHKLRDLINWNEWLNILAQEAQSSNPDYRLVKRRIAWLLGKWHADDSGQVQTNPLVWQILLALLTDRSPASDLVVRLSASAALYQCLENIDFSIEAFQPFLPQVREALFSLLREAETVETKDRILQSINAMIGQAREKISPFIPAIMADVPQLWTTAGEEADPGDACHLKQGILIMSKELVEASREQSALAHPLIVGLIRESMAPTIKTQLGEDAMNLWQAAARNCTTLHGSPGMMDLLEILIDVLGSDFDLIEAASVILESYFLVDATSVLQACGVQLMAAYLRAHKSVSPAYLKYPVASIELLIQLSPSGLWADAIVTSGLFAEMLKYALAGKGGVTLICAHFYIFGRMALSDPGIFVQAVVQTSANQGVAHEETVNNLMDAWWRNFDSMAESRHRKLAAMAMASLGTTGHPEIVKRLPNEIANVWMDVLGEIKEAENDDPDNPSPLHTYWTRSDQVPTAWMKQSEDTLEEHRRKAAWNNDIVRTVKLTRYIAEALKTTEAILTPPVFKAEFIDKTDPTVIEQLNQALAH